MSRLEARLGVQLLQRSTRRLHLTPEGCQLFERGKRVLADLEELEACVAVRSEPRGLVRINTSSSTGKMLLVPLVPQLLQRHPGLSLELSFTDQIVDLVEAGTDIAVRWGQLPPSDMVARLLGHTRQVILASPEYLARMGGAPASGRAGPPCAPGLEPASAPYRTGRFWWTASAWPSISGRWCASTTAM